MSEVALEDVEALPRRLFFQGQDQLPTRRCGSRTKRLDANKIERVIFCKTCVSVGFIDTTHKQHDVATIMSSSRKSKILSNLEGPEELKELSLFRSLVEANANTGCTYLN